MLSATPMVHHLYRTMMQAKQQKKRGAVAQKELTKRKVEAGCLTDIGSDANKVGAC